VTPVAIAAFELVVEAGLDDLRYELAKKTITFSRTTYVDELLALDVEEPEPGVVAGVVADVKGVVAEEDDELEAALPEELAAGVELPAADDAPVKQPVAELDEQDE
jgi:hypothetical protein